MTNGNCPVCGAPALLLADCHCSRLGCQNYHPRMNVVAEPKRGDVQLHKKGADCRIYDGRAWVEFSEYGAPAFVADRDDGIQIGAMGGAFPTPGGTTTAAVPRFKVGDRARIRMDARIWRQRRGKTLKIIGLSGTIYNLHFEGDDNPQHNSILAKELEPIGATPAVEAAAERGFAISDEVKWKRRDGTYTYGRVETLLPDNHYAIKSGILTFHKPERELIHVG